MTLERYDPERLDGLALRVLDVSARLRAMAQQSRNESLPPLDLHDHKALEWLEKLEEWLFRAEGALSRSLHKARGERRARELQSGGGTDARGGV